jgi:hypothetical protein
MSNASDNTVVSIFADAGPDTYLSYSELKSACMSRGMAEKTAEASIARLRRSRVIGEGSEGNKGKLTLTGY